MKIKYEFADGTVSEVEVEESIGTVIIEDRRPEDNLARKERYHCHSPDAAEFESSDYGTEETPETLLAAMEEDRRVYEAFHKLSEVQQRRLLMLAGGMSIREIARQEGSNFRTVHESVEAGRKNLNSFSEKHPIKTATKSPYSEGHKILPFRNRRWKGEAHIKDQLLIVKLSAPVFFKLISDGFVTLDCSCHIPCMRFCSLFCPIPHIHCIHNCHRFSAYAVQAAVFLYPGLELPVYFLKPWNIVPAQLCRMPAQFMKQGRCRMERAPVCSVFYKMVSFSRTLRQMRHLRIVAYVW